MPFKDVQYLHPGIEFRDFMPGAGSGSVAQAQEHSNDQQKSQQKQEQEPFSSDDEKESKDAAPSEVAAADDDDDKKVRTNNELSKNKEGEDDKDVDKRFGCNLVTGNIKRPNIKILIMSIVVAMILLVVVLWTRVKNALFRSSSLSSQGGSKFQEF